MKKELEILLSYLSHSLDSNLTHIGEIDNNDVISSIYSKIKSLKIVKFINSNKFYNLENKINFFILLHQVKKMRMLVFKNKNILHLLKIMIIHL